jgi:hypothetical protein
MEFSILIAIMIIYFNAMVLSLIPSLLTASAFDSEIFLDLFLFQGFIVVHETRGTCRLLDDTEDDSFTKVHIQRSRDQRKIAILSQDTIAEFVNPHSTWLSGILRKNSQWSTVMFVLVPHSIINFL